MAIDGYFLNAQIKEFEKKLINGKLRKISGLTMHLIVFEFFTRGKKETLLFNFSPNSAHMRLINESKGDYHLNLLNILKKELLNSTLLNIYQYKKDRIIFFEFSKADPFLGKLKRTIVFEVMGRNSNLILLDEQDIILEAAKKMFNEDKRSILPNIKYELYKTTKKEFKFSNLKEINEPIYLFNNYMGFSKDLAFYVYNNKVDIDNLDIKPTLFKGDKILFHAYDINLSDEKVSYDDTSSLLNAYYDLTTKSDDHLYKLIVNQKDKLQIKLNNLNGQLLKNKDYENLKDIADMIYSSGLNLNSYQKDFNGYPLDEKLTLNQNAQKLYKDYKRLKNSIDFLNEQIAITNNSFIYFDDLIKAFKNYTKDDLTDLTVELSELGLIKKKKVKQKAPKKYLTKKLKNATIYIGKTSKQNDELVNRIAKGDDLWFHIKDYPGAHVILKGEKTEENILIAARKALIHSSLKNPDKGYINYTKIKYVKKIKDRPGFYVTIKNEKTIYISL